MKFIIRLIICLSILHTTNLCFSQVFLQLEKANSLNSIKFYEGDVIEFKLKAFPKTWRKEELMTIKPEENILVFESTFYKLEEFHSIKLQKPWAKSVGTKLVQFSAAWYLYGGIASVASEDYTMSKDEIIIGGVIAAIGAFVRSAFSKKVFKLNKRKRLRILDLRMSVP
ncbi:MAG: hypothetical protein HKO66_11880 [Saprospiraceae bacterium]|nr:hypothetical protein [Bacteroidia bacterium]NNE13589.1 hypothetical protein [Saprospiraceae bacterium]NNL92928.1 hypothetical protein [Saprospiraceae bacterium]